MNLILLIVSKKKSDNMDTKKLLRWYMNGVVLLPWYLVVFFILKVLALLFACFDILIVYFYRVEYSYWCCKATKTGKMINQITKNIKICIHILMLKYYVCAFSMYVYIYIYIYVCIYIIYNIYICIYICIYIYYIICSILYIYICS